MKSFLLSALCAVAALSIFVPDSQAQGLGGTTNSGTGTTAGTGLGQRRRGAGGLEQRAREIIAKFDKDGDHALNQSELAAFFEAVHQRVEEHRTQQASNNTTSSSAATGAAAKHPGGSPQEHAAKAIQKFDKNGDGKLEAGELVAMLQALRERRMEHEGQAGKGAQSAQGTGKSAPLTPAPVTLPPQS